MGPELFEGLKEERSIFRIFDSSLAIGDFEAFHSPRREAIAHWNMAYPMMPAKQLPNPIELGRLLNYYAGHGLKGHLATSDRKYREKAAEDCEYFRMDRPPALASPSALRLRTEDLRLFASVIQSCFILSDASKEAFLEKMRKLQSHEGSRFHVVETSDGRILGCANTVRTTSGADFLFNVGTVPDFADAEHILSLVVFVAARSKAPLLTYHRHPLMRDRVLRRAGFTSLGTLYCVPLEDL